MKRFLFVGGIVAVLMLVGIASQAVVAAGSFTINSFSADYYLDKDAENRSTLKTVEKITAAFPNFNQNHGIERAIPEKYDGHSTSLQVASVTDDTGKELTYSTRKSNGSLVLRIGDSDTYVHGRQTYTITYTQRDVTTFFSDTNDDEFYWDVNGTGWEQAMGEVNARVHVSPLIAQSLNNKASCYYGREGATTQCAITRDDSGEGTVFSMQQTNIKPNETVTFAIGFTPQTFTAYQPTAQEKLVALLLTTWVTILVITSLVAVGVMVWASVVYYKLLRRVPGRGSITPEYLPPKEVSVLISAQVLKNNTSDMTAQIIDLAVRHYIKIYLVKEKTFFEAAQYELEIVKAIDDLHPEERRLLMDLFGKANMHVGSRFKMSKLQNNSELQKKLLSRRKQLKRSSREEYKLFERAKTEARKFTILGWVCLGIGIVALSPLLVMAAIMAFIYASGAWPLTQKGVALRDYLNGLKLYISVAEKERLQMLQSPEGAEKVGRMVTGEDPKQLVKLYERVLPYAVLFGIEKEWTKQLGTYYEMSGAAPDWYAGSGTFNAVVFSSALSGFSSQSSTYSSSTSASSGGSGGGGYSGGGGGGGGGGSW